MPPPQGPNTSVEDFRRLLRRSSRVLALCGAGLSAASGLPTFRGPGGLWRSHDPAALATPEAFAANPQLVWLFYAWRKQMALRARPNPGHYALAELARRMGGFLCLTQNVDGLSTRAGHPPAQLRLLHGSLLDVKCSDEACGYAERDNLSDPPCPALAAASVDADADGNGPPPPLLDPATPLPRIAEADLPHCPRCRTALLRPGVVWFGEPLDPGVLGEVRRWILGGADPVDLALVVGTAAAVWPAAGYVAMAEGRGAAVAVVNPDEGAAEGLGPRDFFFRGDAAELLPRLLEGVFPSPAA